MTAEMDAIIRRFAAGEITAIQTAGMVGGNNTVAEQEAAELARARKILGLDRS